MKDTKEIINRIYSVSEELEDILYDLRREEFDTDEPAGTLNEWKTIVLKTIPKGNSLAFRINRRIFRAILN